MSALLADLNVLTRQLDWLALHFTAMEFNVPHSVESTDNRGRQLTANERFVLSSRHRD